MSAKPQVLAIVGPTASGKSALADAVAARLGSEVISVDAMQVYRGMDIGTAKTPESERPVPLRMVDVVDPSEDYSVRLFQRDARQCADALLAQGRTPILCGGTGLYLNAVIDEMDFPQGDLKSDARVRYESFLEKNGALALHALLQERDPASAELIHPNNTRRVVRALELLEEGKSYAVVHEGLHQRKPHYAARIVGLRMPRELLYARIDSRVDRMVESGLVEEVRGLLSMGLAASSTALQAIGYKEIVSCMAGDVSLDEAIELIKRNSRRYAKRQISWFNRDGRVEWIDADKADLDEVGESLARDFGEDDGEKGI